MRLINRVAWGRKRFSAILISLLGCLVYLTLPAVVEGQAGIPCTPEPTDMEINYGDLVRCRIDFAGDSDVFRFFGQTGERVTVDATGLGIDPCIELIGPDTTTVGRGCDGSPSNRIDAPLNQTGQHTILITARIGVGGRTGDYGLSLQCLAGPCVPPPTPDVAGNVLIKRTPPVGSTVTLRNVGTGTTVNTTTDPSGRYLFHPVEPGTYEVTIGVTVP